MVEEIQMYAANVTMVQCTPAQNALIKYRGQLTTGRAEYAGGKMRSL